VASWRWDKRGSGESYLYESGGRRLSLGVHVSDAAQAIVQAKKLEGFSSSTIIISSSQSSGRPSREFSFFVYPASSASFLTL
jgi:hypothetical protein